MPHALRVGDRIDASRPKGYYIDLSHEAPEPTWPPSWLSAPPGHYAVAVAQFGLGCHERFLAGEGEAWLGAAASACRWLTNAQSVHGQVGDGGWYEPRSYPHTYRVHSPWLSAMAQGQAASLLVRVYLVTGDASFAAAALRAVEPFRSDVAEGGVTAALGEGRLPQEYPTDPPSHVLNGALFALWGLFDAATGLQDGNARLLWNDGIGCLAASLSRWDAGYWSRYDLFPHPIVNLASPGYHALHIAQLHATELIHPDEGLTRAAGAFQTYSSSTTRRSRAVAHKVAFRFLVPRSNLGQRAWRLVDL